MLATMPDDWYGHVREPTGERISIQTYIDLMRAVLAFMMKAADARNARPSDSPPPTEG